MKFLQSQGKRSQVHRPVLLKEAIHLLHVKNQARYIDATVGAGGHSVEIVKRGGIVLGLDKDPQALRFAQENLEEACLALNSNVQSFKYFTLVQSSFRDILRIAQKTGFYPASGIIFDLGISSLQIDSPVRGFSFRHLDSKLDMRMDTGSGGVTAADLVNGLREDQLKDLFSVTISKAGSAKLARRIVEKRRNRKIVTVGDFLELVGVASRKRIHPATLAFMALRIAVNNELDDLKLGLPSAFDCLKAGGRMVVISFHSGEDRIVKDFVKKHQTELKVLTDGPIKPSEAEVKQNPRSRSAKLRAIKKLEFKKND